MCLSLEVVMECSRIHMLMIACECTDYTIISTFSVEKASGGQGRGSLAEQGGRVCSRPGVLSWAQKPVVERTGDQDGDSGNRQDAHEGVCVHPLVTCQWGRPPQVTDEMPPRRQVTGWPRQWVY